MKSQNDLPVTPWTTETKVLLRFVGDHWHLEPDRWWARMTRWYKTYTYIYREREGTQKNMSNSKETKSSSGRLTYELGQFKQGFLAVYFFKEYPRENMAAGGPVLITQHAARFLVSEPGGDWVIWGDNQWSWHLPSSARHDVIIINPVISMLRSHFEDAHPGIDDHTNYGFLWPWHLNVCI